MRSEGHRKAKARVAAKGIRVGKNRVLRLMRAHGLLAPGAARTSPRRPDLQRPDSGPRGRTNSGARTRRGLDQGGFSPFEVPTQSPIFPGIRPFTKTRELHFGGH